MNYLPGNARLLKPWEYSWEYAELSFVPAESLYLLNIYGIEGGEVCEIRKAPERGDTTLIDARNRTIAEMGVDGWELVSIVANNSDAGRNHENQVLYFKRVINPEAEEDILG